jgi:hypothetical protein
MPLLGPTTPPQIPIGYSDYVDLRRSGATYVDKTAFIADVLDSHAKVQLYARPRRFGKTLNISALRHFLDAAPDAEARRACFIDAAIWQLDGGRFRTHFAKYPTIHLTFKDLKAASWADLWRMLGQLLNETLDAVLSRCAEAEDFALMPAEAAWVARLRAEPTAPDLSTLLPKLSDWLHRSTGEQVVILIDEYDSPLHSAWENGYWDKALAFFRAFFSGGLKDNPALFKGVLTGILKVAKDGLFSGLNNLETNTLLSDESADRFGFTEDEVTELALARGLPEILPTLRSWYNGYRFGETRAITIYNPWSIAQFLKARTPITKAYWVNTSDNALVGTALRRHAVALGPGLEALFEGGALDVTLDENVPLQRLASSTDAVLGLLAFSGYLTVETVTRTDAGPRCALRVPNREVLQVFRTTFSQWVEDAVGGAHPLDAMLSAILSGDAATFALRLESLLLSMMSYHDVAGDHVEAVYQAFMLGLLAHMSSTHRVTSNREAGLGRADLLITPRLPGPGAILELKRVLRDETPEHAMARAIEQLSTRRYDAEVFAAGATRVYQYAIVFDGKRCAVTLLPV